MILRTLHWIKDCKWKIAVLFVLCFFSVIPRGGGGGTPLYGLYRYVPRNRVWFLEVLDP